jgi:hypothetical protein
MTYQQQVGVSVFGCVTGPSISKHKRLWVMQFWLGQVLKKGTIYDRKLAL